MFEMAANGQSLPSRLFLRDWCRSIARLAMLCLAGLGLAQAQAPISPSPPQDCRLVFDMGSSGVRAAASGLAQSVNMPSRDIDLLTPLMLGQRLESLLPAVESALRELPQQAQLPPRCHHLGGGFSAWRLAWRQGGPELAVACR